MEPESLTAELTDIMDRLNDYKKRVDESTALTLVTRLFERVADLQEFLLRGPDGPG